MMMTMTAMTMVVIIKGWFANTLLPGDLCPFDGVLKDASCVQACISVYMHACICVLLKGSLGLVRIA